MKHLLFAALSIVFCITASAQEGKDFKYWPDGPVTMDDLQPRTLPKNAGMFYPAVDISPSIKIGHKHVKTGNLRYSVDTTVTVMDKLDSWYDTDSYSEWTLRYAQTYFDVAELSRREIQNDINRNGGILGDMGDYFVRKFTSRLSTFTQETGYGRDTSRLLYYEVMTRFSLDTIQTVPIADPTIKRTKGFGMFLGYTGEVNSTISESVGMMNGLEIGWTLCYKRLYSFLDLSIGANGKLRQDGFFYDKDSDYTWQKGKSVTQGRFSLGAGLTAYDSDRLSFHPVVSIGVGYLDQNTGKAAPDDSSEINGLRLAAGVVFDLKLKRSLDATIRNCLETGATFKIFLVRTNYGTLGPVTSINFGISTVMTSWTGK